MFLGGLLLFAMEAKVSDISLGRRLLVPWPNLLVPYACEKKNGVFLGEADDFM